MDKVTYTIGVYVTTHWATGSPRGTAMREFFIEEDRSILGAMRAIDIAVEKCNGHDLCEISSPTLSPNPALEGWPLGV